jgi:hypothetical protein
MFPEDDTYQAAVDTPGKLFLDIDYLCSWLDWKIKQDLKLVSYSGYGGMDRQSAQDMEHGLSAWDQSSTITRSWISSSSARPQIHRRQTRALVHVPRRSVF